MPRPPSLQTPAAGHLPVFSIDCPGADPQHGPPHLHRPRDHPAEPRRALDPDRSDAAQLAGPASPASPGTGPRPAEALRRRADLAHPPRPPRRPFAPEVPVVDAPGRPT